MKTSGPFAQDMGCIRNILARLFADMLKKILNISSTDDSTDKRKEWDYGDK